MKPEPKSPYDTPPGEWEYYYCEATDHWLVYRRTALTTIVEQSIETDDITQQNQSEEYRRIEDNLAAHQVYLNHHRLRYPENIVYEVKNRYV